MAQSRWAGLLFGSPMVGPLLVLAILGYAVWTYQTWKRLRHVPGPLLWSLTPFPLLSTNLKGDSHKQLSDLSKKYGRSRLASIPSLAYSDITLTFAGPVVRIGPNAVLTTDYKHCQKMEAPKSPYRKGPWYGTFRFQKGKEHSFAMLDEARHATLRTKVGPGYSGTVMVVRLPWWCSVLSES
jgi:hypothetical protein